MENSNNLSTFKVINEDIKAVLRDLDERISEQSCSNPQNTGDYNEAFLEILDKLLEARSSIEELKKYSF